MTLSSSPFLPTSSTARSVLSPRETEVLQLISEGLSSKHIADRLSLSEDTIEAHRRNILIKLKASNMMHAVALAVRNNLIP